jgi:hypothetical protein
MIYVREDRLEVKEECHSWCVEGAVLGTLGLLVVVVGVRQGMAWLEEPILLQRR